jgi:hypothetical protein
MHVRVCPECGEEFRPDIVSCSDCGATLRDANDDVTSAVGARAPVVAADPPGEADPGTDYALIFSTIESDAMRDAAAALAHAGLTFRVAGNATGFQLLVRRDDRPRASQALGTREGAVVVGPESDAAAEGHGGPCPACGTALAACAVECPDCGLVLGGDTERES